jgi:hypothetical protein
VKYAVQNLLHPIESLDDAVGTILDAEKGRLVKQYSNLFLLVIIGGLISSSDNRPEVGRDLTMRVAPEFGLVVKWPELRNQIGFRK